MIKYRYLCGMPLIMLCTSSFGVTKQAEIEMSYKHIPYVKLIGTAPGSNRVFDNNDISDFITPVTVDLGTMGLDSNVPGDCEVNFSTLNNFDLKHTVSGQSFTRYKVLYRTEEFGRDSNQTLTMPCTSVATSIQFRSTGYVWRNWLEDYFVQSGTYSDTINVVVTTQ